MADTTRNDGGTVGYEVRDESVFPILGGGLAIFVVIFLTMVFVWAQLGWFERREARLQTPAALMQLRTPRSDHNLQVTPGQHLGALTRRQAHLIERYSWVDARRGIVRIPIERAMEILAGDPRRRLPVRGEATP